MRSVCVMKLHLGQEQISQADLTKHTVNTDTEGLDQELQSVGHSMDPWTTTDGPTYRCTCA